MIHVSEVLGEYRQLFDCRNGWRVDIPVGMGDFEVATLLEVTGDVASLDLCGRVVKAAPHAWVRVSRNQEVHDETETNGQKEQ